MKIKSLVLVTALSALAVGCGGGSSSSPPPSGSTGTMSLRITDAPIDDATKVVVQFSEAQVRGVDGSENLNFTFDPPKSIDLLQLQGSATEDLFIDKIVPAGVYKEIRLIVDAVEGTRDTYIVLEEGGQEYDMTVPSGAQSGLKVKGEFTVSANATASFTVDFDVRKSIVKSGNVNSANGIKYKLKPVLRIVNNSEVGHIAGTVEPALLLDNCSDTDPVTHNAVYVYEGSDITPDDIDGTDIEPVVTALVKFDESSGIYSYEAAFLVAGDYTISLTCNADLETIEGNEDLKFKGTQNVPVVASETAPGNF